MSSLNNSPYNKIKSSNNYNNNMIINYSPWDNPINK
jgi:hypothetical protein